MLDASQLSWVPQEPSRDCVKMQGKMGEVEERDGAQGKVAHERPDNFW